MKLIQNASKNLKGKRVLVRADFNVLDKKGRIESDFRIKAVLPTIKFLIKNGARVVLASHAGRPNGKPVPEFSLKLIQKKLETFLKTKVAMAPDCIGPEVKKLITKTPIAILENLRFHTEEEKNQPRFAKALAENADWYVNDAFGVCHRANASVVAITRFLPSYAGFLLQAEIQALSLVRDKPEHPFVIIIGGAKASDKIPVIKNLAYKADKILIGGASATTFLKAHHYQVAQSLHEPAILRQARDILHGNSAKIVLPIDVVVAEKISKGYTRIRETSISDIHDHEEILDIGDYTIKRYLQYLKKAATIFWSGPLGNTDFDKFSQGTKIIAQNLAKLKGYAVVGGGETVAALEKYRISGKIGHVSTGGGAALEFLSGKNLPGIKALEN